MHKTINDIHDIPVRQVRKESIRQRIRKLLQANDLSSVWQDWNRLYKRRSDLFHGRSEEGSEHRGSHLEKSQLARAGGGGDQAVRKNCPLDGTARRDRGSRPCQGAFRSRLACRTVADLRRSNVDGVRKGDDGGWLVAESPGRRAKIGSRMAPGTDRR